jgi:small conductance mechanosensitive channel
MEGILSTLQEKGLEIGLHLLYAIAILIIGRWIALAIRGVLRKMLTSRKIDLTIVSFVCSMVYIALMTFVVLAALSKLGFQTTSFVAVIGAAGLAIGLALQGSLANFAAGFLMVVFRPFKVGDFIEGAGTAGIVEEIQVFTTQLRTPDNKTIIIPNAKLTGDIITNYSAKETRRVEWIAGVSYRADVRKVKEVLQGIVNSDGRILKDPAPQIALGALADSSVNFVVRVWVKTSDYWDVFFDTMEKIKLRFDEESIEIPFPQRDVHIYQQQ